MTTTATATATTTTAATRTATTTTIGIEQNESPDIVDATGQMVCRKAERVGRTRGRAVMKGSDRQVGFSGAVDCPIGGCSGKAMRSIATTANTSSNEDGAAARW